MQATDPLLDRIKAILKPEFEEGMVDVSLSGIRDNIHVVVMSRRFDDMLEKKKQELLWSVIDQSDLSDDEKLRISLIVPLSPDEVK
jgi:hypothetical protein